MKNLWREALLCFGLCYCATATYFAFSVKDATADELDRFNSDKTRSAEFRNRIAQQKESFCESLGTGYQEHYGFETRSFNVSICRRGGDWYYYRKPKSNPDNALLIPAQVVFDRETFKAVDGKVTYFVGVNSEGYYSSVMYGNNRMVFEPELPQSAELIEKANSAPMDRDKTEPIESLGEPLGDLGEVGLDLNYWQVCTASSEDLHPNLNGWQRFIGDSTGKIDRYASNQGHKFAYSTVEPTNASIETTDGLLVNLSILQLTDTVRSICVKPTMSF